MASLTHVMIPVQGCRELYEVVYGYERYGGRREVRYVVNRLPCRIQIIVEIMYSHIDTFHVYEAFSDAFNLYHGTYVPCFCGNDNITCRVHTFGHLLYRYLQD